MKLNRHILSAACVVGMAGSAHGQNAIAHAPDAGATFQFFSAVPDAGMPMKIETLGRTVTGKPLSAVEVRRTRQTLGDGTHIDKVEKDKYYRDFDGRVRIERENGGSVSVSDPSSQGNRTRVIMRSGDFTTASVANGVLHDKLVAAAPREVQVKELLEKAKAEAVFTSEIRSSGEARSVGFATAGRPVAAVTIVDRGNSEDLGDQVINGVMAHGTRNTITIPVGQIGNDREIKVVSERWFSEDLGLLIRSSNNDPRFGETTFELTDILQGAQDPTLFQLPETHLKRE